MSSSHSPVSTAAAHSAVRPANAIRWLRRNERRRIPLLAEFFTDNVSTCYISHTELWSGRARDFGHWAPGLLHVIEKEMRATFRDPAKRVAIIERNGELAGMAVVVDLGRYALLEDIVIRRARRGCGVGRALVRWIFRQLRESGKQSVFLESGGRNTAAHRFFRHQGFRRISISMCRRLAA